MMNVPFTREQFFSVFERYNNAVFPAQIIILLLGLLLFQTDPLRRSRSLGTYLGLLWVWMGVVYHIGFFRDINPAAMIFGVGFIIEGSLILINTFSKNAIQYNASGTAASSTGYVLQVIGSLLYPAIGYAIEGSFARLISVGLPCPSTILTFGFFLLVSNKFPTHLLIIPSLWAVIGAMAAMNFGVYQDVLLPVAAIIADILLLTRRSAHTSGTLKTTAGSFGQR